MEETVAAFDLGRMFFGDEPPLFLLEIAFRTVLIYGYTLFLIRWIGGRSIGQLSLVEFLLVIALGSAVGDAMFYPDVPLLHCMVVITVVVLLDKALSYVVAHSPRAEDLIEGKTVEIVRDGRILWKAMNSIDLGHDELFEQLRLGQVEQLGQVRAAYFETNGFLSVFKAAPENYRPGLSIMPPWDVAPPRELRSGEPAGEGGPFACARCANVEDAGRQGALSACSVCGGDIWHVADGVEHGGRAAKDASAATGEPGKKGGPA